MLTLTPGNVTLSQLEQVWRTGISVRLDPATRPLVEAAAARIQSAASGDAAVYGVNTGFGKLASVQIPPEDTKTLQRNLILSHCCGVGEDSPAAIVRLMMVLKLISLGRGASGVRPCVIDLIEAMLEHDVTPVVPAQGSVGASGDLAPLAHMAAVMIGEGEAIYEGKKMPGATALVSEPFTLRVPDVDGALRIDVSWTPVPDAAGYRLYRTTAADQTQGDVELLAVLTGAANASYADFGDASAVAAGAPTFVDVGELGTWRASTSKTDATLPSLQTARFGASAVVVPTANAGEWFVIVVGGRSASAALSSIAA